MSDGMNVQVRRTLLKLAGEYIVVTAPIIIYVVLEAVHDADASFLYKSPEWSIATIFLLIQTIRIYLDEMHGSVGRLFSSILVLFLAIITIAAGVNMYIGLGDVHHQSLITVIVKWTLFGMSSMVFVYVAGAAIYAAEQAVA